MPGATRADGAAFLLRLCTIDRKASNFLQSKRNLQTENFVKMCLNPLGVLKNIILKVPVSQGPSEYRPREHFGDGVCV
jgi:hypothetical protein